MLQFARVLVLPFGVVNDRCKMGDTSADLIEAYEIRERASGIDRYPVLPQNNPPAASVDDCWHRMCVARILLVLSPTRKGRELRLGAWSDGLPV